MREVKAVKINAADFAPYGTFCSMTEPEGYPLEGEIHKFYPDRISGTCVGTMAFSPIEVRKDERIVKMAEYHTTTWEGIVALDDDMLIHVAPASGGTPVPELAKAFLVPKGCMVKINAAIWHLCPLPANNEVLHAMIVLPECTYANDCTVVEFEEKDWFKNIIKMKQIDFDHGTVTGNILGAALPMLVAQILSLLYNIVDRIYIARIPSVGTTALGAVGLCFPIIVIITAFSNLFGSGGAPLFSINRGKGNIKKAEAIMNTSFSMLCICGVALMVIGMLFASPILVLFGASEEGLSYAYPYMMIYLIGIVPSMIATGMNPFINAQGYATSGMLSVTIGAVANLILDPLFIFGLNLGIKGAAIATIISQTLSAAYVFYFLRKKAELKVRVLSKGEWKVCRDDAKNIVSLGSAGFIMQLTNSLVTICCNSVLSGIGGDVYISVMTIVSSVRQMVETPIYAINEGTSPILSYNYGAQRPKKVKKAICVLTCMILIYTAITWSVIIFEPEFLIGIFSTDSELLADCVEALKLYFAAFIFMDLQYVGQTVFKSLNKKKQAIFFSLLRKVFIVVPLTYLFPYTFHMGTRGVFLAEPISNVIGGSLCFITMLVMLKRSV